MKRQAPKLSFVLHTSLISLFLQHLPSFGNYLKEREKLISDEKRRVTIDDLEGKLKSRVVLEPTVDIPTIQDVVGRSLSMIGTYNQLNNRQQVVALIDEV